MILLFVSALIGNAGPGAMAEEGATLPTIVYKILTRPETRKLEESGRFEGSEQDIADGFIHLSTHEQLTGTADRHFAGKTDLFVTSVDVKAAGETIRWEISPRSGLRFPHLYGPLDKRLVIETSPLRRDGDGHVVVD